MQEASMPQEQSMRVESLVLWFVLGQILWFYEILQLMAPFMHTVFSPLIA